MALVRGTTTQDRRIPSASSYTVSHNHTVGSDGYLFVVITCPATTVSSVTYAGAGMTLVQRRSTPYSTDWTVWRLAAPSTGTNTLSVTMASGNFNGVSTFITSYTGCSGVGNTSYNGTQSSPVTSNITLLANSMVIGCVLGGNSTNANVEIPIGTARTLLYNHNVNNFTWGSVSPSLSAGTITCEGNSTATMIMMLTEVREAVTPPSLSRTPTSLSGFTYAQGSGPSAQQTFTVSGDNLTANVTVTAPTNYEVSTTSGSGFGASVVLTQSGGNIVGEPKTVYVRLKSGLTVNTYTGNVTIASTGATSLTVALSGSVTAPARRRIIIV